LSGRHIRPLEFAFDPTICRPASIRLGGKQKELSMRIFVAGSTGAVGRELVRALVAAGYSVTGLTRTAMKAVAVKRMGAEPVVADGLDAPAVRAAVLSAKPDVVIDEMTDLAAVPKTRGRQQALSSSQLQTAGRAAVLRLE
jgi:uncharacterized protein YbjT (DUF2867 family)